ncbi:helix-turn-helix domain-containing protein [Cryptosporangium arvum]|uniref:helix-turn-helix domain-containing protein n=1 Tax=Cryptosporangium arvum TaxID=80871 RepID=UPI0004B0556E|nr:AraC family transcriptional regulator [Cryptosporangium arvum]
MEPDAVSSLLDRMRWTVSRYDRVSVVAGADHRFFGAEVRFHHVLSGDATLTGPASASIADSPGGRAPDRDAGGRAPGVGAGRAGAPVLDRPRSGNGGDARALGNGARRIGAGDAVLALRGGDYTIRALVPTVLLSAVLDPVGEPDLVAQRLPTLLLSCGFATREPVAAALLAQVEAEWAADRPGTSSVVSQLATVVAAIAVRAWVESGCDAEGWHRAAADPDIARVTAAIRADPGAAWTVDRLARVAHVSRSTFAERFHAVVGESPARFVLRIRTQRAKELLTREGWSVARTAVALGYGSEAAFSRAFRRVVGVPPSTWRTTHHP